MGIVRLNVIENRIIIKMYNTDPVSHRPAVIKVREPQPNLRRDHEKSKDLWP